MKLRYFVGTPEDAFRKHDIVFTSVEAADRHCERVGLERLIVCDSLFVFRAFRLFDRELDLLLILDLENLCTRFDRTHKGRGLDTQPSAYWYFEEFAERLVRLRQRSKLKEAA